MRKALNYFPVLICAAALLQPCCGRGDKKAEPEPQGKTEVRSESGRRLMELENGFKVIIVEAHKSPMVAVETFYGAGFAHEPSGKPHVAHLAEHLWLTDATADHDQGQAFSTLQQKGMVNGETLGALVHFDYLLPADEWELALQLEAERLTSLNIADADVSREVPRMLSEVDFVLGNTHSGGLIKFGLLGLTQAFYHGAETVDVYAQTRKLKASDARAFIDSHYTPGNGTIVVVGDIDADKAAEVVEKYLGAVPAGKPVPEIDFSAAGPGERTVTWDLGVNAVYLADPRPVSDIKEITALMLFGNYLNMRLRFNSMIQYTFCSNQLYPPGELPFFVFGYNAESSGEPGELNSLKMELVQLLTQAAEAWNRTDFENVKTNFIQYFLDYSLLDTPQNNQQQLPQGAELLQEAINLGIKEILRQGMDESEYRELIQGLDFDFAAKVVRERLAADKLTVMTFAPEDEK